MTTHIDRRIAVLERRNQMDADPLVVFGKLTANHDAAIEQAERIGRRVIYWPVTPPLIEQTESKA